jgi:predicted transcriptional regulator
MKAILMSIRPEWCDLIIREQKTIEVRRTRPKLETPFRVYVYCTFAASKEFKFDDRNWNTSAKNHGGLPQKRGRVIGEFICDDIRRIGPEYCVVKEDIESKIAGSCLTVPQVKDYAGWKGQKRLVDCRDAYCWHISNFKLYKKPVRLKDFWAIQPCTHRGDCCTCRRWDAEKLICRGEAFGIERPPQSWCYVEDGR